MPEPSPYTDIVESPIGWWQIHANNKAITHISYAKTPITTTVLRSELTEKAVSQLSKYFQGTLKSFDLPLAIESYSPFYKQVWGALARIPYGKTASYLDLAVAIDNPKAVRAVGMANGRNPIPIILPCHRVIGSDRSLTGYVHGLEVKRWLLEMEGAIPKVLTLF